MSLSNFARGRSRWLAVFVASVVAAAGWGDLGIVRGENPTRVPAKQAGGAAGGTVKGHSGGITDLGCSPDGKKIVSSCDDGKIKIWDADKGEEILTLSGHRGPVICVAFSPDQRKIASGGYDSSVRLWDVETGKELQTLSPSRTDGRGGRLQPERLDFSPDGKRILCAGNGSVYVLDLASGKTELLLDGHKGTVVSARFSPDGKLIASGARDRAVKIWDAQTGKELRTFGDNDGWVEGVAFSPDGKKVAAAVGSKENKAKVWEVASGKLLHELVGHCGGVMCIDFSPDGKRIATGGADRTVRVWDADEGRFLFAIQGYSDTLRRVAFSPDGKRIVAGAGGRGPGVPGDLKVWDSEKGTLLFALSDSANAPSRRRRMVGVGPGAGMNPGLVGVRPAQSGVDKADVILEAHRTSPSKAWSVSFSPDGARIASGGEDQTLKVSDAQSGREILSIKAHPKAVRSVAFSADGKNILSGGIGIPNLSLWDASTGKQIKNYKGHGIGVLSVAFSPDGKRIASGGADSTVKLWGTAMGNELRTFRGHGGPVTGVAFSPDGSRIVSSSLDKTARVWNANTARAIGSLIGHNAPVNCVAYSPDGTRIVTGSDDKTLKIWDATTGKATATLSGHTGRVVSVAFSPDSLRILSGGEAEGLVDNTIKIWDAQSGQEVGTIRNTSYFVTSVAYSPDGKRLAAGCDFLGPQNPGVRVWTLDPAAKTGPSGADLPLEARPMTADSPLSTPAKKAERIVLIPTAEEAQPASWHYTTTDPGAGWESPTFEPSSWNVGRAGFCSPGHFSVKRNTVWRTKEIWVRQAIQVPASATNHKYVLRVGHDDDLVVYVNGKEIYQKVGVSGSPAGPYREVVLDDEKAALFHPGKNVVAAKCIDTGGECALDIGLALVPKE